MIAKKSPKSCSIPTASTIKPTKLYLNSISKIPVAKHMVPRIFVERVKNTTVFCGPIMSTTPMTNRI